MKTSLSLLLLFLCLVSCRQEPTVYTGQYPDDVAAIINNKCATAGCHNQKSAVNAAGLRLDRWDALFEGSVNGSAIVPYSAGNSSLLYFINSDSALGPVVKPQMPLNAAALSAAEYKVIRNWIASGAPDKTGSIPFGTDPGTRQKVYITQQGCDLVAVVDVASNLIMRYISIGMSPSVEVAHCVRFTQDGKYAYISFSKGQYIQKIDAATDQVVGSIFLGPGSWNLFHLSPDGKRMLVSDMDKDKGRVKVLDLDQMTEIGLYEDLSNPHGIVANKTFDTFFVTSQYGNTVYRISLSGVTRSFSIVEGEEPNANGNTYDPHEIIMAPDYSRYFLTCEASDEVRVMDARTNKLITAIKVGDFPQEFAMSSRDPYLFVSCENEVDAAFPGFRGVVYVINYETLEIVKRIPGPFYQIHGITVDDKTGRLYIASRNLLTDGPPPHHTSECGGRNGYYNVYNSRTFEPLSGRRYESTVDPYSADVRFK